VPFDYLRINHPEKRSIDIWIPLCTSFLVMSFFVFSDIYYEADRILSIVDRVFSFIPTLIGFYVAALAAVATFNKPNMDEPMPGDPIRVDSFARRETDPIELVTRRRFLCLLFGYLCALSILIAVLSLAGIVIRNDAAFYLHDYNITAILFGFVLTLLVSNLFTTTLLGMYYLVDRIHQAPLEPTLEGDDSDGN
jgi:uncharacterized membrane protein